MNWMDHFADIFADLYFHNPPVLIQNNKVLSTAISIFAGLFADLSLGHHNLKGIGKRKMRVKP